MLTSPVNAERELDEIDKELRDSQLPTQVEHINRKFDSATFPLTHSIETQSSSNPRASNKVIAEDEVFKFIRLPKIA